MTSRFFILLDHLKETVDGVFDGFGIDEPLDDAQYL
jgi:hypothetical protein